MVQVAIIGLGPVGGSLGLALQEMAAGKGRRTPKAGANGRLPLLVVGYDPEPRVAGEALSRRAVGRVAYSLKEAVEEAGLVIIAQSGPAVRDTLQDIAPLLKPEAIVTDTSSNKVEVLRWAEELLPPEVSFVGGHPVLLPDREVNWESGLQAARADLFQGAIYCIIPGPRASSQAVDTVQDLAYLVGAEPFFLDALEHDGLLAGLNHLPYLLAAAMLATIGASAAWRDLKLLADPAFRHLQQLLSARPADFYQTCFSNRQPLLSWLDRLLAVLGEMRRELAGEEGGGEYLRRIVEKARTAGADWQARRDERLKELEALGAQIPSARQSLLSLFLPYGGRRREERD